MGKPEIASPSSGALRWRGNCSVACLGGGRWIRAKYDQYGNETSLGSKTRMDSSRGNLYFGLPSMGKTVRPVATKITVSMAHIR